MYIYIGFLMSINECLVMNKLLVRYLFYWYNIYIYDTKNLFDLIKIVK